MAAAGLLALLDDIASILDDVALLTKTATQKTAGVLGDDLALNAQLLSGSRADRELPIIWAVARGSARNKMILVPTALLLSAYANWLITPLLLFGGIFLCLEGVEKVWSFIKHHFKFKHNARVKHPANTIEQHLATDASASPASHEQAKIQGAIRTDLILSAEIVVIALGVMQEAAIEQQVIALSLIAALMTIGVYGLVAAIIKLDDLGLFLLKKQSLKLAQYSGRLILQLCPYLMKSLSVVGTLAMFLVGGGIVAHSYKPLEQATQQLPIANPWLNSTAEYFSLALIGILVGTISLTLVEVGHRLFANTKNM